MSVNERRRYPLTSQWFCVPQLTFKISKFLHWIDVKRKSWQGSWGSVNNYRIHFWVNSSTLCNAFSKQTNIFKNDNLTKNCLILVQHLPNCLGVTPRLILWPRALTHTDGTNTANLSLGSSAITRGATTWQGSIRQKALGHWLPTVTKCPRGFLWIPSIEKVDYQPLWASLFLIYCWGGNGIIKRPLFYKEERQRAGPQLKLERQIDALTE